ncbi:hypothetical protein ASPWEDRAFT_40283 [Aspergillus wentii DTO 134E9]|uniref:D-isomer specific 2-hydroxyacid dehydrogenase NAD-binding domain-containing protein n=1 Tax=Aspergillus wentii DTO 134E9 TaxID=1073089 RepID=A0A1L9RJK8_ASPWE|nr:uncharacterized protein ASPWEDRAFT_40283 [Aspergillus wentii DTO 134E9]KAI9931923.1 hypothetical protein MW887_009424 [Aspergillus wentii]OJJ35120.1 hypothetical protein ASPWEDRAFT_40283 [Aspergillus wentii DTO 134E9]
MSPPSPTHHNIVHLQADFTSVVEFDLPAPHTYTNIIYPLTALSDLHERIRDATIITFANIKLDAVTLSPEVSPHLKFIAIVATGTDCVDLEACRKRGIVVSNCPSANIESVSEHALGLYFATRRRMFDVHMLTRAGEWRPGQSPIARMLDSDGERPLTCQEEVVGIVGNGNVGKRIATLARALGMTVMISGRKTSSNPNLSNGFSDDQRVPFETVMKQSTVIFLAVPLTSSTKNLISTPEFESMSPHAVLVNVSRGGVVDEEALVQALKENQIAGAATDVFREEPADPANSPLLAEDTKDLNLVVTPHVAWAARKTKVNQNRMTKQIVEDWAAGSPSNLVI